MGLGREALAKRETRGAATVPESRVCPGLSPRCPSRRSKPASRLSWFLGSHLSETAPFPRCDFSNASSERRDRGTDGGREIERYGERERHKDVHDRQ